MSEHSTRHLLERIAVGVEALAAPAPSEPIELGPPHCPACGEFDPVVEAQPMEGGKAYLSDMAFLSLVCTNCGSTIHAVVQSYSMHANLDTLMEEVGVRQQILSQHRRAESNGNSG